MEANNKEHLHPNIAVIGPTPPIRGGIALYNSILIEHQQKQAKINAISFRRLYPAWLYPGQSQILDFYKPNNFPVDFILDPINPFSWIIALQAIRKNAPTFVVIHWWHIFFGPMVLSLAILIRLVSSAEIKIICHNIAPHDSSALVRIASKMVFQLLVWLSKQIIFHSNEQLSQIQKKFRDKSVLLPHPVYIPYASSSTSDDILIPTEFHQYPIILFFGFIRPYKGLHVLIQAFADLVKSVDARLVIAGECWGSWQPYSHMITKLGLGSKVLAEVRFLSDHELSKLIQCSTVIAMPYLTATQSGAIALALGYGVPIVASNVGGISTQIKDEETGILVRPNNVKALCSALVRAIQPEFNLAMRKQILAARESGWETLADILAGR